jgi:hypothetical protein
LKPSVSSGVFCILFAAVGKKYAAGGKKHYVKKKPAGGKKRKATGNISRRRHVPYEKGPAGRKAPVGDKMKKPSTAEKSFPHVSPRKKERAMARSFLQVISLVQS